MFISKKRFEALEKRLERLDADHKLLMMIDPTVEGPHFSQFGCYMDTIPVKDAVSKLYKDFKALQRYLGIAFVDVSAKREVIVLQEPK